MEMSSMVMEETPDATKVDEPEEIPACAKSAGAYCSAVSDVRHDGTTGLTYVIASMPESCVMLKMKSASNVLCLYAALNSKA